MNAVKRCLTVLAVALAVGACGEDASAPDAGTDLHIRATPSSVWMRDKATAEVLLEAVDKLGGAASGSWEATGSTGGIFTVALDSSYQNSSAGAVGVKRRFVITATSEGDDSVSFSGTGGSITIPVRIAPDTLGLDLVFTSPVQVAGTVTVPLNASVTAGLLPGLRFTSGTTVILYTGPLTRDTSIFRPINFSIAADSTHLTFTPGPNSSGRARITGIANISTPSLSTFGRTAALLKTEQIDTAGTDSIFKTPAAALIGDTVTVTIRPNYRFTPATTVNYFTQQSNGGTVNTNGQAAPFKYSLSADSLTLKYLPAPGVHGQPRFTNIVVRNNTVFNFAARAKGTDSIPAIPNFAATFSSQTPAPNTRITITMPVGTKLRPNSRVFTPGVTLPALVISRSADSNSIVIVPPPGFDRAFNIDSVQDSRVAPLKLTLPTSLTVNTSALDTAPNALPNLGTDDATSPSAIGVITLPAMAVGDSIFISDKATLTGSDWFEWGGNGHAQDTRLNVTTTGNYSVQLTWDGAADIDVGIMNSGLTTVIGGFGGMTGANPEIVASASLTGGLSYFIITGNFSATAPQQYRYMIRRNS